MAINDTFVAVEVKNHPTLNRAMFYGTELVNGSYMAVCYTNTPHAGIVRLTVTRDKFKTRRGAEKRIMDYVKEA